MFKKHSVFLIVVFLSLCWGIYLVLTTSMILSHDAQGYYETAVKLHQRGLWHYWNDGAEREFLYLLWISSHIDIARFLNIPLLSLIAFNQIILLLITQIALYVLLVRNNVNVFIALGCASYIVLSPALMNTALSLFSEILVLPLLMVFVLCLDRCLRPFFYRWQWYGVLGCLILSSMMLLCVKASLGVVVVLGLLAISRVALKQKTMHRHKTLLLLLTVFLFFQLGIHAYKAFNQVSHGSYIITDRGAWHFYGNAIRRTTFIEGNDMKASLFMVLGDGVCQRILSDEACLRWSFQESDVIGLKHFAHLKHQGMTIEQINQQLIKDASTVIQQHPLVYLYFTMLEWCKIFFWESTKIGFVHYPHWLESIYNNQLIVYGWRVGGAIITGVMLLMIIFSRLKCSLLNVLVVLIGGYMLTHALGTILPRYTLVMVPLMLVALGLGLNHFWQAHCYKRTNDE